MAVFGSRTRALALSMPVIAFAMGCENLIGTFEVAPPDASVPEAGVPDAPVVQEAPDGGQGDSGPSSKVRVCEQISDCPALPTAPAGCAVAECKDKVCVYVAIDQDGDGHHVAGCKVDGAIVPGDDCADTDPTIFPGASCSKRPNGSDIVFPNGTPLGACKAGAYQCVEGKAVCQGAVEPQATENCTLKNDANCNGVPDDGCDCTPNTTGPCGNTKNLPLPCMQGTRTCSPQGKWGDCVGNIEPMARDCGSTVDNDCNGQPDQGETACNCAGGVAQGKTAACTVAGQLGECAKGAWTCMPSADKQTGVFGPCGGPKPAAKDCKSALDNDCNGISDELDLGCGTPCMNGKLATPAAQKFTDAMWGCPGARTHSGRAGACSVGLKAAPCSGTTWEKYSSLIGARRPTRKYWVNEMLGYGGTIGACYADSSLTNCGTSSMSVCPATKTGGSVTDADGNTCNWTNCGYGLNDTSNDYFGGCIGNDTAGTLCCLP